MASAIIAISVLGSIGAAVSQGTAPALEDVPTDRWPAEMASFIDLGGCAFVPSANHYGLTCETKLEDDEAFQSQAPGASGTLCEYCPASCEAAGQACGAATMRVLGPEATATSPVPGPVEDVPTDQWPADMDSFIHFGGCAFVPSAHRYGVTCETKLEDDEAFQSVAPGASGTLCEYCPASCEAAGQACAAASMRVLGPTKPRRTTSITTILV